VRELLAAAAGLISRRRGIVLVIAVGALLPAELLARTPASQFGALTYIGGVALNVIAVVLVAVLLADLQGRPLTSITLSGILGASVRSFGALLIAACLLLLLAVPIVLAVRLALPSLSLPRDSAGWGVLSAAVLVVFAPVELVVPVCLRERGGPWWSLKRAWSLSRPRRLQIWALLGGLAVLAAAYGQLSHVPGLAPLAALIACSIVSAVLQAALVAVIYVRLVAEEPPPPVVATVRSRARAAEGTFRSPKSHRTKQHARRQ
jgi:hypothetical protein